MSDINIEQTDLNITVSSNPTALTVYSGGYARAQGNTTEVQYNNGGVLAGANGLTYNSGTQTTTAGNLTVTNNTDLGNIGNITISGGNSGEVLTTDGSGGLSFTEVANANFASFAGNIIEAAQPNITSVGNLSNLTVTGNVTANYFLGNGSQLTGIAPGDSISNGTSNVRVLSTNGNVSISVNGNSNVLVANSTGITVTRANLGNIGNLTIIGGNNGQFLQTDGTGNLAWATGTTSGNGVVGGSNTQIQYNDAGLFGGTSGFTFDKSTNAMATPGNITAVGNISGNYILGNGSLLTGIVTSANSIVSGNSNVVVAANANVTFGITGTANVIVVSNATVTINANLAVANKNTTISNGNISITGTGTFVGDGYGLSNIAAANIVGSVPNATHACTANTVVNAAQSNITSLGTLTGLNVNGNLVASTITCNTGVITGNANGLSSIQGANVIGVVANANFAVNATNANNANIANSANTAGTVTTAAQPNITSVGTLTSLTVTGNITAGNTYANSGIIGANLLTANLLTGTLTTASQPNVTSIGTLTALTVNGNITAANITANTGIFSGNGNGLTNLNASNLSTGTVSNNRLSGSYNISVTSANTAATVTTAAQPNITSIGTLGSLNVSGRSNISFASEKIVTSNTAITGNINFDILNGALNFYYANATGNFNLNMRGNSAQQFSLQQPSNTSITVTIAYLQGSTPYSIGNFYVDNTQYTINWASGVVPNVFANTTQVYTFNIVDASGTTFIYGTGTRFG